MKRPNIGFGELSPFEKTAINYQKTALIISITLLSFIIYRDFFKKGKRS